MRRAGIRNTNEETIDLGLKDKAIVVTAASAGIGKPIAVPWPAYRYGVQGSSLPGLSPISSGINP